MADLLLELFSEEIPARMQADAAAHFLKTIAGGIVTAGLLENDSQAKSYVSPRHLAVLIPGVKTVQPDVSIEKKGPKIDAPEAAIQGFLKSNNITLDKCEKRTVGKDEVYFAVIHQKGQPAADVIKSIIEKTLVEFTWPKSMRWGSNEIAWVRPLHNILCLFDSNVIPVTFAGLTANDTTYGHRFLNPGKITISKPADYVEALKKAFVMVERDKRMALIQEKTDALAKSKNLTVKPDKGLLEEVTGLVEWPTVYMAAIDQKYMDLPPEVLISEMKNHQKYFSLQTSDGSISQNFLIVSNMPDDDKERVTAIISGNERVLRARLSDGRFFWDQDRKKKLGDWNNGLKDVIFHAKIGTVAEKVDRIAKLADQIAAFVPGADKAKVKRAAELCKADLVTGMVGEFAELQGIMGRYYAQGQKEPQEVADAIRDHYSPLGPTDKCPTAPTSICVALADKIDTLVSMFAIGEKPTGSKDPYALRRAALGIIRIILENNLRLQLKPLFANAPAKAIATHKAQDKLAKKVDASLQAHHHVGKYATVNETATADLDGAVPDDLANQLYEFFADRLKVSLKDQGIRHDYIAAVIGGDDDLIRITARAKALQDFLATDDGKNLLAAYKRAANILSIEEKKDKTTYNKQVNAGTLSQAEEKSLHDALGSTATSVKPSLEKEDYKAAMSAFSKLRVPTDAFFDKVMVNDKDAKIRENRLNLLAQLRATIDSVANFGLIEG